MEESERTFVPVVCLDSRLRGNDDGVNASSKVERPRALQSPHITRRNLSSRFR